MPLEYQKEGDIGFIGLNSRDNPASLPAGIVSKSQNFRFDRGVATVRKGLKRLTSANILNKTIYGVGTFIDGSGQEIFVIVVTDGVHTFNPETGIFSTLIPFPAGETITTQVGCDVVTAIDKIFISRGHSKRPLICTLNTSTYAISGIIAAPSGAGAYHEFPNCSGLLYYANRMIAIGKYHSDTETARSRDSVSVSNYLDFQHWAASDVFSFNEGGNDEVVAIAPWTLNEFIVFMKNSIFYVGVGTGIYADSAPLNSSAYMKNLVSDLGCKAKNSVVLAGGGVIFLSDNGIYVMNPTQVGSNESLRLLTSSDPLSSNIDDIIQRINKTAIQNSVGIYWNNRYYLAVPLDSSTDNNAVLVYNFILKNWESVDTYPAGFDIIKFGVGKKSNQRRQYGFDTDQGVFLMEELEYDEYGASTGTPVLPFILPQTLNSSSFTPNQIQGELKTRLYTYSQLKSKRFSTLEVDLVCEPASQISTYIETLNPDTSTLVDNYGSPANEDSTRRLAIRKIAYGLSARFTTNSLRASIRAVNLTSTLMGKKNISKT
jgi:hypothetical protein